MDELIDRFIDLHPDKFAELFEDNVDFQNAHKDIQDNEYSYFIDPEEKALEAPRNWCEEHKQEVIDYFYRDAIRIENLVITPEDFDLLNKLDIIDQDANGTYLKGSYMGHQYEVHAFIYNCLSFVYSIKCITDYKECSSLYV